MAVILPNSMKVGNNPRYLQDALTPCIAIPGGKVILFSEIQNEGASLSSRQGRLSTNGNSAAVMSFVVNQEVFEDPLLLEIFTKSVIGGYSPTLGKKVTPYKHPYLNMYAKDIVELNPFEFVTTPANQVWMTYNLCKVTINFETLPYGMGYARNVGDDYNRNFCKIVLQGSSQRVSIPTGFYVFSDGVLPVPCAFGAWFSQPTGAIEFQFYSCPRSAVFGGAANAFAMKPFWSANHGKVNQFPVGGCAAQTLLFDSSQTQVYRDCLNTELYNVKLNFLYNEWTWNKTIDMAGAIRPMRFVLGVAQPFDNFLMAQMLALINPLNNV